MSKRPNKNPRKVRKIRSNAKRVPRPVSPLGGLMAIDRRNRIDIAAKPLPPERQSNVAIAYHTAIDAMTSGRAQVSHYDTIIYALNIGLILARNGFGAEYEPMLIPAMEAMHRCRARHAATGKFGLDGEGLQAIKDVADLHEAQLELAPQSELQTAIEVMHRLIAGEKCYSMNSQLEAA